MRSGSMDDPKTAPPVPATFWQYVRSMGPGLIVALTWLGAGDMVDSAVAGGNYGYALMWAMVVALFVRFLSSRSSRNTNCATSTAKA